MVLLSPAPSASRLGIEHPLPPYVKSSSSTGGSKNAPNKRTELARLSQEEAVSLVLAKHAALQASLNIDTVHADKPVGSASGAQAAPAPRVRRRVKKMTKSGRNQRQVVEAAEAVRTAPSPAHALALDTGYASSEQKVVSAPNATSQRESEELSQPSAASGEAFSVETEPLPANQTPKPTAHEAKQLHAEAKGITPVMESAGEQQATPVAPAQATQDREDQKEPEEQDTAERAAVQEEDEQVHSPPSVRPTAAPPASPAPEAAKLWPLVTAEPQTVAAGGTSGVGGKRRGSTGGVFSCCASSSARSERRRRSVVLKHEPPADAAMFLRAT